MKKILTMTIIFGTCMIVNAQNPKFGAKGGVNLASLTGKDIDGAKTKTAFHIGLLSEIPLSEKFSFQPELLFSVQGNKESYTTSEFKLNYMQLPLIAKYYIVKGFSIEAGPQIGVLLSAKAKVEGEGEGDVKEIMNNFDYGVNFGVGYKLTNGLNFSARYNLGLSKVFNNEFFVDNAKVYNSVLQFSIGYFFN